MTELLLEILAVGNAFTVMVVLLLLIQPAALISVRVYVVVAVGITVLFAADELNPDGLLDHE